MHIITKLTTLLASATLVLALAVPALTAESSPLVFQDDSGTELRLAAPATRIVALYGASNAMLLEMGLEHRIIPRTSADPYAAQFRKRGGASPRSDPSV